MLLNMLYRLLSRPSSWDIYVTSGTSYLRSIYTVYPQYYPEKNISELKLLFTNQHEKVLLWYSKACHSFIKMGSRKFEITHIFFTYKLMLISLILIYHDVFTASQPKFTRSKSTIETPEQCVKSVQSQWRRSDIFIVNYNLNIFDHTLFCCFYPWLWANKCHLGTNKNNVNDQNWPKIKFNNADGKII